MEAYDANVESAMRRLFESLNEKDRRRYAAVEAVKLGHGGVGYVAGVLGCDPKTVWQGLSELEQLPEDPAVGRVRKKGAAAESSGGSNPLSNRLPDRLPDLSNPAPSNPAPSNPIRPRLWSMMFPTAAAAGLASIRSTRRF
jgi:hypothetical protein